MKAITIWQPWASLIACGAKKFETRSWTTAYRGPIAIHAAQKDIYSVMRSMSVKSMTAAFEVLQAFYGTQGGIQKRLAKTQGCIVATAELVACHKIYDKQSEGHPCLLNWSKVIAKETNITGNELLFGDWTSGRYAWELQNVKMLDTPIPAKGKQRIWNWEGTI